jgi:hypothetical protein
MRYAIGLDIAGDTQEAQGVRVNVDVNVFRSDRVGMMIWERVVWRVEEGPYVLQVHENATGWLIVLYGCPAADLFTSFVENWDLCTVIIKKWILFKVDAAPGLRFFIIKYLPVLFDEPLYRDVSEIADIPGPVSIRVMWLHAMVI